METGKIGVSRVWDLEQHRERRGKGSNTFYHVQVQIGLCRASTLYNMQAMLKAVLAAKVNARGFVFPCSESTGRGQEGRVLRLQDC